MSQQQIVIQAMKNVSDGKICRGAQTKLARTIGVTPAYISHILQGENVKNIPIMTMITMIANGHRNIVVQSKDIAVQSIEKGLP